MGGGSWLFDPIGRGSWWADPTVCAKASDWLILQYRRRLLIGWSYVRRLLIGWSYSIGGGSWLVNNTNEQPACPDWARHMGRGGCIWRYIMRKCYCAISRALYCILLRLAHVRGPLNYITPSGRLYILYSIYIYLLSIVYCNIMANIINSYGGNRF